MLVSETVYIIPPPTHLPGKRILLQFLEDLLQECIWQAFHSKKIAQ